MEEVGASLWLHYLDLSRICPPGVRSIRYQHLFCILIPELTTNCLLRNFQEFFKVQNPPNLCCIINSWRLQYKAIVPAIAFELNLKQMVDQVFFIIFYLLFFIHRDPWFCTCEGGRQTKGQRQSQTRPQRKRQIHGQYQEKIEKQGKRLDTNTKAWTNTRPLYL